MMHIVTRYKYLESTGIYGSGICTYFQFTERKLLSSAGLSISVYLLRQENILKVNTIVRNDCRKSNLAVHTCSEWSMRA